jgi:hypothetical protein
VVHHATTACNGEPTCEGGPHHRSDGTLEPQTILQVLEVLTSSDKYRDTSLDFGVNSICSPPARDLLETIRRVCQTTVICPDITGMQENSENLQDVEEGEDEGESMTDISRSLYLDQDKVLRLRLRL